TDPENCRISREMESSPNALGKQLRDQAFMASSIGDFDRLGLLSDFKPAAAELTGKKVAVLDLLNRMRSSKPVVFCNYWMFNRLQWTDEHVDASGVEISRVASSPSPSYIRSEDIRDALTRGARSADSTTSFLGDGSFMPDSSCTPSRAMHAARRQASIPRRVPVVVTKSQSSMNFHHFRACSVWTPSGGISRAFLIPAAQGQELLVPDIQSVGVRLNADYGPSIMVNKWRRVPSDFDPTVANLENHHQAKRRKISYTDNHAYSVKAAYKNATNKIKNQNPEDIIEAKPILEGVRASIVGPHGLTTMPKSGPSNGQAEEDEHDETARFVY
ncbi:hypothetical protein EW146_g3368, partial [Bondarzewia mesenterica]